MGSFSYVRIERESHLLGLYWVNRRAQSRQQSRAGQSQSLETLLLWTWMSWPAMSEMEKIKGDADHSGSRGERNGGTKRGHVELFFQKTIQDALTSCAPSRLRQRRQEAQPNKLNSFSRGTLSASSGHR